MMDFASHASRTSSRIEYKRPSTAPFRPPSPAGQGSSPAKSTTIASTSKHKRQSSSGHGLGRSNSISSTRDSGLNHNRWSQSTASSANSSHHRAGSFSKRFSVGASTPFTALGALATGHSSSKPRLSPAKPGLGSSNSPSKETSERRRPPIPATSTASMLPPIITLPSLSQEVNSIHTPSTASTTTPQTPGRATPSTAPSTATDMFGMDNRQRSSPRRRPSINRNKTAPSPVTPLSAISRSAQYAGLEPLRPSSAADPSSTSLGERPSSRNRSGDGDRKSRGRSHSRHSEAGGSGGVVGTGVASSASSTKSRDREKSGGEKQPSQKAMLSKALQKANTAVLLDNAQNFGGAMDAYREACSLLGQVMSRSSGDDDKRKLEAIRNTYTNRIKELNSISPAFREDESKALPARPDSNDYKDMDNTSPMGIDDSEPVLIETATITRIINDPSYREDSNQHTSMQPNHSPRKSPSPFGNRESQPSPIKSRNAMDSWSAPTVREFSRDSSSTLKPPLDPKYMPPPLSVSPRPLRSPEGPYQGESLAAKSSLGVIPPHSSTHSRTPSTESISWLDTIDESGGSSASSVHSRNSNQGLRRKRIRAASGATEAEFDAALDAAVEAAYDDGFEPAMDVDPAHKDIMSAARRNVEIAKERVREAEREAVIQLAKEREKQRLTQKPENHSRNGSVELEYGEDEEEEEERMLEEMTRGYVMDDFEFDLQSKSALPRQSDSSSFSGRTWGSSIGSNNTTGATSLRTLSEAPSLPMIPPKLQSKSAPPPHPPPTAALPPPPTATSTFYNSPPTTAPPRPPSNGGNAFAGVRGRRLSGQNHKQLKIETATVATRPVPNSHAPITQPPSIPPPKIPGWESHSAPSKQAPPSFSPLAPGLNVRQPASAIPSDVRRNRSPLPQDSPSDSVLTSASPATAALTKTFSQDSNASGPEQPRSGSPRLTEKRSTGPGVLRKNYSSSSLKNRNLSVSSPEGSEVSPSTPLSNGFSASSSTHRKAPPPSVPALPTPSAASFTVNGLPIGGLYLFDSDIHSPTSPGSPNPLHTNGPSSLEPCPSEVPLRPFWLMRCLYQTIAHPKGGYLSTKLFVPRDVWRVKVTKLKGLDEKISNCDLLTAALLKLDQVDTFDADAVLEEMQSLEHVLDQVQAGLVKKLGNEVGVQGSSSLFKDAPVGAEPGPNADTLASKSTNTSSKSSYLSWRRLRNKQSGAGLTNNTTTMTPKDGGPRDTLSMSTLPMTSASAVRYPKRELQNIQFSGPNATYMSALAKLFDAAQVLDQIARQVEDPGLKHSSPTQVGLELSTRHAAEFFAFYVCRFVLTDLSMMMDKFIKRGSEWVGV